LGFKVGAEVGVYRGVYAGWLLRYCPGLKLYAVDSWTSYPGYTDPKAEDMADAYNRARQNTRLYDCTLIKGWSSEVVKQFEDESLDFVFIDGNHAYEYVVEDIACWSKKVRKGGIIYGHDFDDYSSNEKKWQEINVINAVIGWMNSYRIHPWFVTVNNKNRCWMYVK
jgi:predicted O-methyltransferase YrrM